jgi:hypothetical protein
MNEEDTPTIQSAAVEILLAKVRRSSQTRVDLASLAAVKIVTLDGVLINDRNRDVVEAAIRKVISDTLQAYHDKAQAILDNADRESELALAKSESEVFRLRKEIWAYVQHGDLDRLTKEALK